MAFGTGAILTVWDIVSRGTYLEVECSSSRKNKMTDNFETDFSSKFVRFCGKAATMALSKRDKIKLLNCSVQNVYEKDGRRVYLKNPVYTVFDYELVDASGNATPNVGIPYVPSAYGAPNFANNAPTFEEIPDTDGLPF